MHWIVLFSSLPFALPAQCWISGCRCDWLCSLGAPGCLTAMALGAGALFALLSLLFEFRSIELLRD